MPRILPSGTGMLPPSSIQETSGLRGLGRACIPPWTLSCRSSRKERTTRPKGPLLRGGICYPFSFTIPHLNLKLSRLSWSTDRQPISFMSRSISSEIFKRPFHAGLTRGRQSIQIKSPSRTRLRAHGKGLQDVGATGDCRRRKSHLFCRRQHRRSRRAGQTSFSTRRADARHDWTPLWRLRRCPRHALRPRCS